jgi:beta-glucosidase-like glycosyl hydrolase
MEEKVWEELKANPFKTQTVSFVVCMNTMGMDKEFTEEERKIALRTVRTFKDQWEEIERVNMKNDVDLRIHNSTQDKAYKVANEELDHIAMEKKVDESVAIKEGDEPLDEDAKLLLRKKA